jgi:2-succinyl-6-hydroxy-2,4-cyclohexadiene-1-carboxylate synthase
MLVAGALDEKFSSIAQKMAARLPNARIEIVRGSGHNVLLERPAAVTALLAEAIDAEARP